MSNTDKWTSFTEDQIEQICTRILETRLADLRDDLELYTDNQIENLRDKVKHAFGDAVRSLDG